MINNLSPVPIPKDKSMLILTRRAGESIMICDSIEVNIQGINGKHVRIGISAPREVPVHREENYVSLQADATRGK